MFKKITAMLLSFLTATMIYAAEPVVSLGQRIDELNSRLNTDTRLKENIAPILRRADSLASLPIYRRVSSLEDFKKLDGKWARKQEPHKRTEMMKNKDNARFFGLASNDVSTMRSLVVELPLLAAAYRLTGDKKYLTPLIAQLEEMVTWDPFQRPGWTLQVASAPLRKDGDGVWLATGAGIQAMVITLDLLPAGAIPQELQGKIDACLQREIGHIMKDYKDQRPWYMKTHKIQSNQWIVPFSGLTLAALQLGKDRYPDAYALGKKCLAESLNELGDEGAVSEGFAYAIDWSVPGLLIPAFYAALKSGDRELLDHPFFRKFPAWVAESYQPGKNVINAFDWWGGCRNMYDRHMVAPITMLTVFTAAPELQWILFNQHATPDDTAFGLVAYGLPSGNRKEPSLFASYRRASRVSWRSSWQDNADGVWIRGRDARDFHAHHDTGHVNYIKNGKIVLLEASTTGYSDPLQEKEFRSFRGHNVLQVGDKLDGKNGVDAPFRIARLDASGGEVVLNASPVYDNADWQREVKWDTRQLAVNDHVQLKEEKPLLLRWHLGTENPADIRKVSDQVYEVSVAPGKIVFPGWIGERLDHWDIPAKDEVITPSIKVRIEADRPISVKAEKYLDHTFKFRDRYHKHTTLEVSAVKAEKELNIRTVFIAE